MESFGSKRSYYGNSLPNYDSYVMKMEWIIDEDRIQMSNDDGIYLNSEYISALLEYSPGSLAITCDM